MRRGVSPARSMKAGGRAGKIITISVGACASARVGTSHYCASKAGVMMLTRGLAMERAEQRHQALGKIAGRRSDALHAVRHREPGGASILRELRGGAFVGLCDVRVCQ